MDNAFRFKHFTVSHDRCAMKVGTDGVLLGAWARGGHRILDIGAGTGLVALMMAQRFPQAVVDAVEMDNEAAEQAKENAARSPFEGRVRVYGAALQHFFPLEPYNAIVTNPPFFAHSLSSPDRGRRMARQADSLPFADIFSFSATHLLPDGELSAIIPTDFLAEFSQEAYLRGMFLARQYDVKTVARKPARRCLVAFSPSRPQELDRREVMLQEADGTRSMWYQRLTEDFYLW